MDGDGWRRSPVVFLLAPVTGTMTPLSQLGLHEEVLLLALRDEEGTNEFGAWCQQALAGAMADLPPEVRAQWQPRWGMRRWLR